MTKQRSRIIQGDCVEVLQRLPAESVDLIFADPPYNLQLKGTLYRPNQTKVCGVEDSWDQFASFASYDQFTHSWLAACKRVLKKDGAIWVIGSYHNIFRVGKLMQDLGFWILNDVVWIKTNPMPNFKGTRFGNAQETLIWAAKSRQAKYTFNYKTMKAFGDDKQMRSDWSFPLCGGKERIKLNGHKAHSTQKPEALLYRVLTATSRPGAVVLDLFMGSGTTSAVAKKLGRCYIGVEKETAYIKLARQRLSKIKPLPEALLSSAVEAKKPRLPFGDIVAAGLIRPGDFLYSQDKKHQAKVLANATLEWNKQAGSIHQISAAILGRPANNGWKFWYVRQRGKLVLLDELRNRLTPTA